MASDSERPSARRKRPVDAAKKYWWASAIAVPVVVAIIVALINKWPIGSNDASPVPGTTYVGSMTVIGKQYEHFTGQSLSDADLQQKIQQAINLGAKREFQGAIALFEQIPESARVPAVWNDLGVAYTGLNDPQRARAAFEKAREKSPGDVAAKANLARLDELQISPLREAGTPVSDHETEPNNDFFHANKILLSVAVGAAIADPSDVDYFVFTTPPVYRDMIDIIVSNESMTLQPALDVYNADRSLIGSKSSSNPAGNINYSFAAPPNSFFYVKVHTADYTSSSGAYSLTVQPLKAYDAYEPNNDIFHAAPISIGQTVEGNIMVGDEADFYQVKSDKAANLVVWLDNRSTSLQPEIEVYDANRSKIGGSSNRNPAGNASYSFAAQPNSLYYVKVRTADYTSSSGAYGLSVRPQ
jgi:Tetratricopeptide repeat